MLPSTLSRFHCVAMTVVVVALFSIALRSVPLFLASVAVFVIIVGLGVGLPRLRFFGPFICRGKTTSKAIALTFDDGPDLNSTPALLDLLQRQNVKAAFFAVGCKVASHPELAARIVREGHLLENHSYHHHRWTNLFSVARLHEEMARTQEAIFAATGVAATVFRPPMGLSNPRIFCVANALGLSVVGWSARGFDTHCTDPRRIVGRIRRSLRPGTIILLHDGNIPVDRLLVTVQTLLDTLRTLGYEVFRLDRMIR